MSEDDIAEHDPLQCTCFDCLRDAGYGLQHEDETQQRESAGGDDEGGSPQAGRTSSACN